MNNRHLLDDPHISTLSSLTLNPNRTYIDADLEKGKVRERALGIFARLRIGAQDLCLRLAAHDDYDRCSRKRVSRPPKTIKS